MDQKEIIQRSLDAGRGASQRTQEQLEAVLTDLVRRSEEQAEVARRLLSELVDRSRSTSEQVVDAVDRELRSQIGNLGLATRADIDRLEAKIEALAPAKKATAKKAPAKRSSTKKATAKKTTAKKTTAKKATAKKPAGS